ncbi:MAG: hypothetical protein HQK83_09585 [Fibrobacteria bacterium]|nr:hypothetical protein [Fibrobacteria bacterium]
MAINVNKNLRKTCWSPWLLSLLFALLVFTPLIAKEHVLCIHPEGETFENVIKGLTEGLDKEIIINDLIINNTTTKKELHHKISQTPIKAIILMDNKAIRLFKKYQNSLPDTATIIPSIALMGVWIERAINGIKNCRGIAYEVPLVTSAVHLRTILNQPITKIGVVYREIMKDFIDINAKYCLPEKISVATYPLTDKQSSKHWKIKNAIKHLIKSNKIDALWVLNDSKLLKPELLRDVWMPIVSKYKIPVIVGVEVLASPNFNFGTFAVIPDHIALGNQLAETLFEIRDNSWKIGKEITDPPISVLNILNQVQAEKFFQVEVKNLVNVDKLLK